LPIGSDPIFFRDIDKAVSSVVKTDRLSRNLTAPPNSNPCLLSTTKAAPVFPEEGSLDPSVKISI
jgi:hypothetical protein